MELWPRRALPLFLALLLSPSIAATRLDAPIQIRNIQPRSGGAKGGTPITITGSGFQSGATVAFGYAPATGGFRYATGVSVPDPGTITATTPPHEPGTVDVIVTNPDGSSAVATAAFSYK